MSKQNSAVKIYQLNYIVGFAISAILFLVACKIWRPPGTDINEPFEVWEPAGAIIEAQEASGSESESVIATPAKSGLVVNEKGATEVVWVRGYEGGGELQRLLEAKVSWSKHVEYKD